MNFLKKIFIEMKSENIYRNPDSKSENKWKTDFQMPVTI